MGLDAGLMKFSFRNYEKELELRGTPEYENTEPLGEIIAEWSGWDIPECEWVSNIDGFDRTNYMSEPLCEEDLYKMINEAIQWHWERVKLVPLTITAGVQEENGNLIITPIDGIEGKDTNGYLHRIHAEDCEGSLYAADGGFYVDPWDMDRAMNFIAKINEVLSTVDWDNEVVVAYYSY